jgi:hypothetical protein
VHWLEKKDVRGDRDKRMNREDRQKVILTLAEWIKSEDLPSMRSFPLKSRRDIERAVGRAQAKFRVSRNEAEDLTDAAFGVAHKRYVKNHPSKNEASP